MSSQMIQRVVVVATAFLLVAMVVAGLIWIQKTNKTTKKTNKIDVMNIINDAQAKDLRLDHDRAIEELKAVLPKVQGQDLANVELAIGSFYSNKNDYKNALVAYQAADKAHPSYGTKHAIGDAALQIRDKLTAIAAYKKCLAMIKSGEDKYNSEETPYLEKTITELGGSL